MGFLELNLWFAQVVVPKGYVSHASHLNPCCDMKWEVYCSFVAKAMLLKLHYLSLSLHLPDHVEWMAMFLAHSWPTYGGESAIVANTPSCPKSRLEGTNAI